jgi:predicted DsbA family dithiol-disulfide isomerase
MKVEIWSDVMCPFCYIGKRKFELALAQFPQRDQIEVEWKSFQLNPDLVTDVTKNTSDYLAEIKGWEPDYAKQVNDHVTNLAAEVGLEYHLDKAIVANSFHAHRFIQFAKSHRKGSEAEENLFKAYFTDGRNTDDLDVLAEIGSWIDLPTEALHEVLHSDAFTEKVEMDIYEAQQVGVRGVPFFVLDRKYAVSGAQAPDTFLQALEQSYNTWEGKELINIHTDESGASCDLEGNCN